ncbi:MAG: serine/threonine-protein kinase [Myxococcota bacterium]
MTEQPQSVLDTLAPTSAETQTGDDGPVRRYREPEPGAKIGRYVVLARLGAGAMGVVFSAYDPELDRRIALKLVRHRRAGSNLERKRLHKEAQALARLSHPNVVGVYDVGEYEGQVFVGMEFVRGSTLTRWLANEETVRPWRQVLEVLVAAGHGLAAAHEQGLVHRDFKPDNVMIGDDGRVRVMDFGLVRAGGSAAEGVELESDGDISVPQTSLLEATVNGDGFVGTPAYMAPEQLGHGELGPCTDQFAFFVVLYEALYGQRPFAGQCVNSIAFSVLRGQLRDPPARRGVPRWLHRVIERGLALSPGNRFVDMAHALETLGAEPARRRRNRAALAVGAVLALTGALVGHDHWEQSTKQAACERAGAAIDDTWSDGTRDRVRAALLATRTPYAATTAANVAPWIDLRSQQWRASRTSVCENATIRERWSPETRDKAAWCLEEQRASMSALIEALVEADERVVQVAVHSAAKLESPELCIDDGVLAGLPAPPEPDLRPTIATVRKDVSKAAALRQAGHVDEGLRVVRNARQVAESVGWEPVIASAMAEEASLLLSAGDFARSESVGRRAYLRAFRSSSWGTAAEAATALAFTVGYSARQPEQGLLWADHAAAAIHHSGDPTRLREATRLSSIGAIRNARGDDEGAAVATTRVLEIIEDVLGPAHPNTAIVLNNLGAIHRSLGSFEQAKGYASRAVEIWEQTVGPQHPSTAIGLHTLGRAAVGLGDDARAASLFRRALEIREAVLGPTHPLVGDTLYQLADSRRRAGAGASVRESYERALEIRTEARGDQDPTVHVMLAELGERELEWGRPAVAAGHLRRALELMTRNEAPVDVVASTRFLLARAQWAAPETTGAGRSEALQPGERGKKCCAPTTTTTRPCPSNDGCGRGKDSEL